MKDTHTITITVPTKLLLYIAVGVLIGLVIGAALTWIDAAGIELVTPLCGVPLLDRRPAVPAAPEAPVPAPAPIDFNPAEHPAVVAFNRVPAEVRDALDAMVVRVLRDKYREHAA